MVLQGGLIQALICLAVTGRRRAVTIVVNSFLLLVEMRHSTWDSTVLHEYSQLAWSISCIFTEYTST